MTNRPLPDGYKLAKSVDADLVLSDEYKHWTVKDLVEILSEHDPDARLWIIAGKHSNRLHPVEWVGGHEGEVML